MTDIHVKSGTDKDLEAEADALLEGAEGVLTAKDRRNISYREVQRPPGMNAEPTQYHCSACRRSARAGMDPDAYDC